MSSLTCYTLLEVSLAYGGLSVVTVTTVGLA